MQVYVHSDLYNAGSTEDGLEFHAEVYYVVIEHDDGRRQRHTSNFFGTQRHQDEDSVWFPDLRPAAYGRAARLMKAVEIAIRNGRKIDEQYWFDTFPVYGSEAYQQTPLTQAEKEM